MWPKLKKLKKTLNPLRAPRAASFTFIWAFCQTPITSAGANIDFLTINWSCTSFLFLPSADAADAPPPGFWWWQRRPPELSEAERWAQHSAAGSYSACWPPSASPASAGGSRGGEQEEERKTEEEEGQARRKLKILHFYYELISLSITRSLF